MDAKLLHWADAPPSAEYPGAIEPSDGKKSAGFANGERPGAAHFNWLMERLALTESEIATVIALSELVPDDADKTQLAQLLAANQECSALCNFRDVSGGVVTAQINAFAVSQATGTILAVGNGAAIYTSADFGATWTARTADSGYAGDFRCAVWDASNGFVIGGTLGETQRSGVSTDGASWTSHTTGTSAWNQIVHGNGNYVISGTGPAELRVSNNGSSWSVQATGATTPGALIFANGLFLLADGAHIRTSPDYVTWTQRSLPAGPAVVLHLGYHPRFGFLAAAGDASDIFTPPHVAYLLSSPDAITWSIFSTDTSDTPLKFAAIRSTAELVHIFETAVAGGAYTLLTTTKIRTLIATPRVLGSNQAQILQHDLSRMRAAFVAKVGGGVLRSHVWCS
jgi:hypothetical protein